MKLLTLIIILFILLPITTNATVDILFVNKITKEYYWGNDDSFIGWIGWTNVPGEQFDIAEYDVKKIGYTRTYYPYKVETFIILLIAVLVLVQYVKRRKLRNTGICNISRQY